MYACFNAALAAMERINVDMETLAFTEFQCRSRSKGKNQALIQ